MQKTNPIFKYKSTEHEYLVMVNFNKRLELAEAIEAYNQIDKEYNQVKKDEEEYVKKELLSLFKSFFEAKKFQVELINTGIKATYNSMRITMLENNDTSQRAVYDVEFIQDLTGRSTSKNTGQVLLSFDYPKSTSSNNTNPFEKDEQKKLEAEIAGIKASTEATKRLISFIKGGRSVSYVLKMSVRIQGDEFNNFNDLLERFISS